MSNTLAMNAITATFANFRQRGHDRGFSGSSSVSLKICPSQQPSKHVLIPFPYLSIVCFFAIPEQRGVLVMPSAHVESAQHQRSRNKDQRSKTKGREQASFTTKEWCKEGRWRTGADEYAQSFRAKDQPDFDVLYKLPVGNFTPIP